MALAQIAALGGTVGFLLGAEHGSLAAYCFAFAFTMLGALTFAITRMDRSPVPHEAIIGITYVVASATVILLAGLSAEGSDYIKETLTGTLIWVTWPTVVKVAVSYGAIGLFHYLLRRRMLAVSFAPDGMKHRRFWDFVFYATFGVAVTSSVAIAGVLMVFSVLVIPAVIAFFMTQDFTKALLLAWASGTIAITIGLSTSFAFDLATGPLLVVSFGLVLGVVMLLHLRWGVRIENPEEGGLRVALFEEAPKAKPVDEAGAVATESGPGTEARLAEKWGVSPLPETTSAIPDSSGRS